MQPDLIDSDGEPMYRHITLFILLMTVALAVMSPMAAAQACPCTIWNGATPSNPDSGEAPPVIPGIEVGVKIQADVDGYITGIRFYKSPLNVGTHVGNIWTTGGENLTSASFVNES